MTEKWMAQSFLNMIEEKIRLFWSRLGAAVERSIGPRSSQPFDVSAILDSVEREIASNARRDKERVLVANRVELRFDYETYSRMSDLQRTLLKRELETSLGEFVHNRRYQTVRPVLVEVVFGPFVHRLEIKTSFSDESNAITSGSIGSGESPSAVRVRLHVLKTARKGELEVAFGEGRKTLGLGRSKDNAFVLDHASVSNFHGSLTLNPDRTVWLSDLASSNGTSIDGIPLLPNDRREVHSNQRLLFGEVELTLELLIPEDRPQRLAPKQQDRPGTQS